MPTMLTANPALRLTARLLIDHAAALGLIAVALGVAASVQG